MRLVQTVGYLAHRETYPRSIVMRMKTHSDASKTLYLGLDVHKAETVIDHPRISPRCRTSALRLYRHHSTRPGMKHTTFPAPKFLSLPHHKAITDKGIENH